MQVNGKNYDINELMKDIDITSHQMQKIGTFYLTNREIEILERNFIDYKSSSSLKDLITKIQNILEDEDLDPDDGDDLDYALESISERDYYTNTKK